MAFIVTRTLKINDQTDQADVGAYINPDDPDCLVIEQLGDSVWIGREGAQALAKFIGEEFPD